MIFFEGGDFVGVLERQADVVQAVQQAVAAERFDFERQRQAVIVGQSPHFQIDRQLIAWMLGAAAEQIVDGRVGQLIGSMPFLKQLL